MSSYVLSVLVGMFAAIVVADVVMALLMLRATRKKEKEIEMADNLVRNSLIKNGVKNLRQFGYPSVNKDNILTDYLFSQFFLNMLRDNKGSQYANVDREIDQLIAEINERFPEDSETKKEIENGS